MNRIVPVALSKGYKGGTLSMVVLERSFPWRFEVDRVGEDQARVGFDVGGLEQVADSIPGLVFDPGIDGLARAGRVILEIEGLELGAVEVAGGGQELVEETP